MTTRANRPAPVDGPMRRSTGMLSADLLDANESTWAFVFVGRVGWNGTLLVKSLVTLANIDSCRSCCGHTADEHSGLPARRYSGMDRAGPLPASQSRRRHGIASAHTMCHSYSTYARGHRSTRA
jgi:hypothetical protein